MNTSRRRTSPEPGQPRSRRQLLAAAASAARRTGFDRLEIDPGAFVRRYYADVAPADLAAATPATLAAAALDHLAFALERPPGVAKVRVFNPDESRDGWSSERTIVEMVNDDMPFLVDSSTMALAGLGQRVHVTIHPIFEVERDAAGRLTSMPSGPDGAAESFIRIEIVRDTSAAQLAKVERRLLGVLSDVRAAVEDWPKMLARLEETSRGIGRNAKIPRSLLEESRDFLAWLADDHFTLLGYRELVLKRGATVDELHARPGTGLGILRDARSRAVPLKLTGAARREARSSNPLVITKSNSRSTVHRPAYLDYISVKVFDANGDPAVERRFLGLFTSSAYIENPREVPLLRLKVQRLMQQSKLDPLSHRGKTLEHILETLPRDDLLQGSTKDLAEIAFGILQIQERHQIRVFVRPDNYGRFYSCLVFLPRDQYNSRARARIEQVLTEEYRAISADSEVRISESALARVQVTVRTPPGSRLRPDPAKLEARIEQAVRTWSDRLRGELLGRFDEERALGLLHRYGEHFSAAYQDEISPSQASHDVELIERLITGGEGLVMRLHARAGRGALLGLTTLRRSDAIPLHVAVPLLENMGVKVLSERIYPFRLGEELVWIQDFELQPAGGQAIQAEAVAERFTECVRATLERRAENDAFNTLISTAGLAWREAALLRAYSKHLLQTGLPFSHAYLSGVLVQYPALCRGLLDVFAARFDPDKSAAERARLLERGKHAVASELERTSRLDEDRIMRGFAAAVEATLRTNFFQLRNGQRGPKDYFSLKLDPEKLAELPLPRPKYEVFVYSPRVEGVHLRCGDIARGGIRWSDRREDFRTEVLGLMKAQRVKNTVIVPDGAKGGFVCKDLAGLSPEALREEVVACYRIFIRGLLDITDNVVGGEVVRPPRVIARDGNDPYLVVAADKGTASFSDIANELAAEYGFWLQDAFASGGSAGYDHKKMAITARGAWESVKRHFRELGVDVNQERFTVVAIGDMSGDVFGNGMLLSPHIELVAAFNHQHVFIDPSPDTATAFAERERLFALPRSSWADYDRSKLSAGGGIYSRDSKWIELSGPACKRLKLDRERVTPPELIRAILKAEVDLLWNGGIGTYVKASTESDSDAADPANDAVRINGRELRCRVVAEGGNLGLTQRGRIEYALAGGRLNTDFIDNSAGVDSSDREVNIKILLGQAIAAGAVKAGNRNRLLASMTREVAELVLANNYGQTQALSMVSARALERIGEHARLIRLLESRGLLDRALECLPSEEELGERRSARRGLTRPELAVILSYSKIELSRSLAETDVPEDPYLGAELAAYFPRRLSARFEDLLSGHPLRRQIVAMRIAGSMVNRMGPFFVLRAEEETGSNAAQVARAYAIVRGIFDMRSVWQSIEALDYAVAPEVQYETMFELGRCVRHAVYWFLHHHDSEADIEAAVRRFRPSVTRLTKRLGEAVTGRIARRHKRMLAGLEASGLPRELGERVAALGLMTQLLDIVEVAREHRLELNDIARLYFELGRVLKLDWLGEQIETLQVEGRWRAMARGTLREQLAREQRTLTRNVLRRRAKETARTTLTQWLAARKTQVGALRQVLEEIRSVGETDFATLSVALKEVARLSASS